jgi:copper transport protein
MDIQYNQKKKTCYLVLNYSVKVISFVHTKEDAVKTLKKFRNPWVTLYRGIGIIVVLTSILWITTPAWAHDVQPTKSEPADGAVLGQPPDKVTVWFPEEVVPEKSTLLVLDAQDKQIDLGKGGVDLNDATHMVMVVSLPKLPEGVYTVKWEVGLTDNDTASGSFHFGVGNVSVPTNAPETAVPPQAPPARNSLSIGLIIAGIILLVIIIGAVVFLSMRRGRKPAG